MAFEWKKRFHLNYSFFRDPQPYHSIALYQIGDLSCKPGYRIDEHRQECYEISCIVSGRGWFTTNAEKHDVQAGDLYINIPGELHAGGTDDLDPFRYVYLGFHFQIPDGRDHPFAPIKQALDSAKVRVCPDRMNVREPFLKALQEMRRPSPYSPLMIRNYLEQIIILTYRNFFADRPSANPAGDGKRIAKDAVYSAIAYIDHHITRLTDLTEVSRAIGYSYSYLSHLFTEETGMSLRQYYAQKRREKMLELVLAGEHSFTEIAAIMHYRSIHTFSRAFKHAVGVSPSEYRKMFGGTR
jgi:AraC-like DNA-binding protein